MKYTIDYNDVSRDIEGPFNIIGSVSDLCSLAEQILAQIGKHDDHTFTYGTVFIRQGYSPTSNNDRHLSWEDAASQLNQTITLGQAPSQIWTKT